MNWNLLVYECITVNWILIGLNWTVSLKCPEMTFVVIWRYVNKIELNQQFSQYILIFSDCGCYK